MFIVRDAKAEDIVALCNAEREVVSLHDGMLVSEPDELKEASFRERLHQVSGGSGKYLVVEASGHLVAHASLWPMGLKKVSHVLRLDMCVHEGHWRQGHGERLMTALLHWARTKSYAHKIELLVRSENIAAVSLYKKHGFTEEGRLKDRIRLCSGKYIDDLSMFLLLDGDA